MAASVLEGNGRIADVDLTLIERSAGGDRDAYDRLIGGRLGGLYHTALGILRHDADAQDAVQDTCVQAWHHLRSLREPERFDAWLGRILVNACRERLRTRNRAKVREIDMTTMATTHPDGPADSGSLAQDVITVIAIRRAFERLKPDDRIILGLHHSDLRSIEDIAQLLGIAEGTAKWRLHAARRALANALGREA